MNGSKIEILLVKANDPSLAPLIEVLEQPDAAFSFEAVADSPAAQQYLQDRQHSNRVGGPHIILLNLNPLGKEGLNLVDELRKHPHSPPSLVYVLTEDRDSSLLTEAFAHNVAGYLTKPFSPDELPDTIATLKRYWEICEF